MPRVDLFKKITNFEYQLHDPNDPSFRQATTTKKNLPKTVNEIKSVIDIEAQKAVEAGLITDRATMEKWLVDLGLQIERTDLKTAISIKNPHNETGRNIRLTGTIYEQDFRITAESAELTREASERYRQEAKQRNAGDIQRYRAHIERKKAQSLMTSIDTTQTTIQAKQSESTAQITQQIEQHTRKILAIQTKQLEQFTADQQAKLAQLNSLSTEIANHSKIRDTVLKSNTVLISIACIALIFSIAMSVISYVKYTQIKERNQQIARINNVIQSKTQEVADLYTQIYNINKNRK